MREKLKHKVGERIRFEAVLFKFGKRWRNEVSFYETVMITDVKHRKTGELFADHVWFSDVKWAKGLRIGQKISFMSTIISYEHGWDINGKETFDFDYTLTIPKGVFAY